MPGTSWPILKLKSPDIFWFKEMSQNSKGFKNVLSVSAVPSVSVENAMECQQMSCLMKYFLRCVFERYDAVCHVGATRRNCLWRSRKPLGCGPKHCRFSRTSHGCLPTSCDTCLARYFPASSSRRAAPALILHLVWVTEM